jgi:hypothetical protein
MSMAFGVISLSSIPLPLKIGGSTIRYRVGQSPGHIVSEYQLTQTSASGNKPVSIPLVKVLSYNCYNNGFEVYVER